MTAMPLRFFLCASCRDTWTGTMRDRFCHFCGEHVDVVDCSPWGGDGRAWFHARMADEVEPGVTKAVKVMETRYRTDREHRASIVKGIRARGNTSARLRGAA